MGVVPQHGLNSLFYTIVVALVGGSLFIAYAIKKLKYSGKQIFKSMWICFLISFIISVLLFVFWGYTTRVLCEVCPTEAVCNCPSGFEVVLPAMPFVFAVAYFLIWVFYYILVLIRNKD